MKGDPLQTFSPGDPLGSIRADTANAWTEAAKLARRSNRTGAALKGYRGKPGYLEVVIQNDTGGDLTERDVVQVSYPVLYPTVYVDDLQQEPAFVGIVPTSASGTPAVLVEPIPNGSTGRAAIMGVAFVDVDITDAAHTSAKISVGDTAKLVSAVAGTGTATILWRETGTGVKLCAVLLCCADGDPAVGNNPDWVFAEPPGGGPGATVTVSDCCSDAVPSTLYVTVSGGGGSHELTWDSGIQQWVSAIAAVTGCGNMRFRFYCSGGTFYLSADDRTSRVDYIDCSFSPVAADSVADCTAGALTSVVFTASPTVTDGGTCLCEEVRTYTVTP